MRLALYQHLEKVIEDKKLYLNGLINDLRSSNTDTKSSMGDKYETSREMLQQEIDRIQRQLHEVEKSESVLKSLHQKNYVKVGMGAEVKTTLGNFCIAFGLGEVILDNEKLFVLSTDAPVAKAMEAKGVGEFFEINGKQQKIIEIY